MASGAALMSIFEPSLEIGLRVLLVMACGPLALVAARMSGRAIRERCAGAFLAAWALGIVGVSAAGSVLRAWPSMAAWRCCGAFRTR